VREKSRRVISIVVDDADAYAALRALPKKETDVSLFMAHGCNIVATDEAIP